MKADPLELSGMHDGASPIIFKRANQLSAEMTDAEKILWVYLMKKKSGFKFRRQHPIKNYILDFYCHQARLSVELDGAHHKSAEQKLRDSEKALYLTSVGIKELSFWNSSVLNKPEEVISEIKHHLREGSPSGGGGSAGNY